MAGDSNKNIISNPKSDVTKAGISFGTVSLGGLALGLSLSTILGGSLLLFANLKMDDGKNKK